MKEKVRRRIHLIGNYSHMVVIPSEWIDFLGLKRGKFINMQLVKDRIILRKK